MFEKNSIRSIRVGTNLKKELTQTINKLDICDICLTEVKISRDLSSATVYCISNTDQNYDVEVVNKLNKYKKEIIKKCKDRLSGKVVPNIKFMPDTSFRKEQYIAKLLETI